MNVKQIASDILETETPDSNNMINDITGSAQKRKGSKRFIDQAHSTNPITSLFRAYAATGTSVVKVTIATTFDRIIYSTNDASPEWITLSSGLAHNQNWEYVMMRNDVIMTGDALLDPIKKFDVVADSITDLLLTFDATTHIAIRAKHLLNSRDHLFAVNVVLLSTPNALISDTTHFNSRAYYSRQFQPSSFTHTRVLFFDEEDGEELTGVSGINRVDHFWKASKVFQLEYDFLAPVGDGGDQVIRTVIRGFGLFAPRTLVSIGNAYIFGDKSGIRFWQPNTSELTTVEESRLLSEKIQPIIDRAIRAGTWEDAVGHYYQRERWYILSFEDPERNPEGRHNIILVLDLKTGGWFPFRNWNARSFVSWDGAGDRGELMYGDALDGYAYFADDELSANDARFELSVHNMDNDADWTRGFQELETIREGTGSIRMTITDAADLLYTSVTYMAILNLGEWPDKSLITKDDLISFKVNVTSLSNLRDLRIDLEIEDVAVEFNTIFTSVTFSSASLIAGNSSWTTIEVALSSFPILDDWVSLGQEEFPFANTLTFYGIRFFSTGTGGLNVYIDDLRVVKRTETPLNAYRFSKQFNFGTATKKEFRAVLINTELPADSELFIDIFRDFGSFVTRESIGGEFDKEIFVAGFKGTDNITKLSSVDFETLFSTQAESQTVFAFRPLTVDDEFIYAGDQFNDRIVKIDKSTFTLFVSSIGSLGSGTTNFNGIYQIAVDEKNLYVCDFGNNRVKVMLKSNLGFLTSYGTLGTNATSFHNPTGCAVDDSNLYVANDGNYNILQLDKANGRLKNSVTLNLNTIGDMTLAVDQRHLYVAYNSIDPTSLEHLVILLERRDKSSLELLDKITVYPDGNISLSTHSLQGDIAISDEYLYISFTDDANQNGTYYIQKRLKSDFSLVRELTSTTLHYAVAANGLAFLPKRKQVEVPLGTEGVFIQVKYSEGSVLDNTMTLNDNAFRLIREEER